MAALSWEPTSVKAHLRLTSQRLGQIQAQLDSHGNIARKDIATLLQQGNVGLARAKAHKLIEEDDHGDLLEILEMEVGILLEHFTEIDDSLIPTPVVAEATSSIIYAAPHVHCRELDIIRNTLIQRFGPDFARSAATNRENYVSPRVIRAVTAPAPSATLLNRYLANVAQSYGVNWTPDPQRHDIVNVLSEMLNPNLSQDIDLDRLRRFCSYGLPDDPSWLRPRVWKLFFGILPTNQASWSTEITKQRDCYYDLVRRLLEPYAGLPPPASPLAPLDEALLNIFKHISRIPREMFTILHEAPEALPQNPLSDAADDHIQIAHASALDERLKLLHEQDSSRNIVSSGPEIRLEVDNEPTPSISVSNFDSNAEDSASQTGQTLVESKSYTFGNAHPQHCSAILRLLFIHASINPGKLSPHVAALLIPLYAALQQEVDTEDLAHVEADTFWLFEAILAEFSELDEEEGGQKWMSKFDSTLAWADPELHEDLQLKGLHPALPHYSYRWLAPLLTYTIPPPAIFLIWDALFSRSPRERKANFKLDFLLDISCAMLLALRKELLSLGQTSSQTNTLWNDEGLAPELASRQHTSEGDAFLEGISLLQAYPLTSIDAAERILQTANDLANRRELESRLLQPAPAQTQGLGARLKKTMWKGFTNQIDSPEDSPDNESDREKRRDDGNETERPSGPNYASTLTSQIASSLWGGIKGIQNSPDPMSSSGADEQGYTPPANNYSTGGIWNYAEKLKDSDAAATLAKVGTNWRARAMSVGPWGHSSAPEFKNGQSSSILGKVTVSDHRALSLGNGDRRDSLISPNRASYQSPAFNPSPTPHRDSVSYHNSNSPSLSSSPLSPEGAIAQESLVKKSKRLLSISRSPASPSKGGPRPLLLSSASPITSSPYVRSGSSRMTTPETSEWADVMRTKQRYLHRDSLSSISSLSPSEALKSARSDWESDSGSRIVPLNRRSVSPMAPTYRVNRNRPSSRTSTTSSEPFSPSNLSASKTPPNPLHVAPSSAPVAVSNPKHRKDIASPSPISPSRSNLLKSSHEGVAELNRQPTSEHSDGTPQESIVQRNKFISPKVEVAAATEDTSDSSLPSNTVSRQTRVRSKRYPQRPAKLQLRDSSSKPGLSIDQQTTSPSNLTVDWPVDEMDVVATPRAATFELNESQEHVQSPGFVTSQGSVSPRLRRPRKPSTESRDRIRKTSADGPEPRLRKVSSGCRPRKVSSENRESRHKRDSGAEEGDDEGYDDLLSAYESEDYPSRVYSH